MSIPKNLCVNVHMHVCTCVCVLTCACVVFWVPLYVEKKVEDKIEEEFGDLDQLLRFERSKEKNRKLESEVNEVEISKCVIFEQ